MAVKVATKPMGRLRYGSALLFDYERMGPGSTITSDWILCEDDEVKTFGFYSTSQGTCRIDVSFIGTARFREYWSDDLAADMLRTASFTEAVKYARGKIECGAAGSADLYYGGMLK